MKTHRSFCRAAGAAIAAVIMAGCSQSASASSTPGVEKTVIMQATDTHFLSDRLNDHGPLFQKFVAQGDGKDMEQSVQAAPALASQVLEEKPDVLVVSGDLTFNGEKASHEDFAKILASIEEEGVDVYVIPGNHDLDSTQAMSFSGEEYEPAESVSQEEFEEIYGDFGYSESDSRDPYSLSYAKKINDQIELIFLDANTPESPNRLKDGTLKWLQEQVDQANEEGLRIVSVTHQSLIEHNPLLSEGYTIANAEKALSILEQGDLIANLSGHLHTQNIAENEKGSLDLCPESLLDAPGRIATLTLEDHQANYQADPLDYIGFENAKELKEHQTDFFNQTSRDQMARRYEGNTQLEALQDSFEKWNGAYFSGDLSGLSVEEAEKELWKSNGGFDGSYIESIFDQAGNQWIDREWTFQ